MKPLKISKFFVSLCEFCNSHQNHGHQNKTKKTMLYLIIRRNLCKKKKNTIKIKDKVVI